MALAGAFTGRVLYSGTAGTAAAVTTAPLTAAAGVAPVVTAVWTPIALVVGGAIRSGAIAPGAAVMTGGMEATLSGVAATRVAELAGVRIPLSPSSENEISEAALVSER